ncbi:protein kinase domain-containing protein [Phormidesmis sp. 146-33]
MSYCLNPTCLAPNNSDLTETCAACGSELRLLNRYFAVKPIAQGGFGRTFWAIDSHASRRCIIKQFFPQQGIDHLEKASTLFRQEAQRLRELGKHPQIPTLLDHLEQAGHQYLIQELIDGRNLAQELTDDGPFTESQIWQLLEDLLPVMQFIHDRQVIHRDIKPANIIRDRHTQKLYLVDLGAAKHATKTTLAHTGTLIGSAEYIAPEQTRGKAVFASDLYSLGTTCIHLLTQMSPFDLYDGSEANWIWQDYMTHSVSNSLVKIINKLLENATNLRYQSVAEVLKDLHKDLQVNSQTPASIPPIVPRNSIEDWDIIAEKTVYQLGLNLSFREAEALLKCSPSRINARPRLSPRPKSYRIQDFAFPIMLVLLTLPVFSWCVLRSMSPPQKISTPETTRLIDPPLQF